MTLLVVWAYLRLTSRRPGRAWEAIREDEDVAEVISESLQKHGATIHHGSALKRMEIKNGKENLIISLKIQFKLPGTQFQMLIQLTMMDIF